MKKLFILLAVLIGLGSVIPIAAQTTDQIKTGKMVKRKSENGVDNYVYATYSFKFGGNGPEIERLCGNNWDLIFGNGPTPDTFNVSMVRDDRSRIKDLGEFNWPVNFLPPKLVAYEEPEMEPSVKAVVGHMYLVHTRDTEHNHYALFRVERLIPEQSVEISWKMVDGLGDDLAAPSVSERVKTGKIRTGKLLKRIKENGLDNYAYATYSFKCGGNGPEIGPLCRNWDLLFGNSPTPDAFDVTTAADDRSRIKDLGKYDWDDKFRIPKLAAYEEPEMEPSAKAVAGHMYLVHTRDTINDYYVLFRVERLVPKESVEISWEVLDPLRDLVAPSSSDDVKTGKIKTAKLQSRATRNDVDNYVYATYSFKFGGNGPEIQRLCRNDWDLLFGNAATVPDGFDVSMMVDDRSRIKDLGRYDWGDKFEIPTLAAYEEPERSPAVRAVAGHMYLVHIRDTDSNHYVLFRVERVEPEKSVEISWKLIDAPQGSY